MQALCYLLLTSQLCVSLVQEHWKPMAQCLRLLNSSCPHQTHGMLLVLVVGLWEPSEASSQVVF